MPEEGAESRYNAAVGKKTTQDNSESELFSNTNFLFHELS